MKDVKFTKGYCSVAWFGELDQFGGPMPRGPFSAPFAVAAFNRETKNGRDMRRQARLLKDAVGSIIEAKAQSDIDSFFGGGTTSFLEDDVEELDDFELVCFLAVRAR